MLCDWQCWFISFNAYNFYNWNILGIWNCVWITCTNQWNDLDGYSISFDVEIPCEDLETAWNFTLPTHRRCRTWSKNHWTSLGSLCAQAHLWQVEFTPLHRLHILIIGLHIFGWENAQQSVMVSIATSARGCAAHTFLVEICPARLEVLDSLDCCLRRSRGGSCSSCAVVSVAGVDAPSMPDRVFWSCQIHIVTFGLLANWHGWGTVFFGLRLQQNSHNLSSN